MSRLYGDAFGRDSSPEHVGNDPRAINRTDII
jgi:hypothetical protein